MSLLWADVVWPRSAAKLEKRGAERAAAGSASVTGSPKARSKHSRRVAAEVCVCAVGKHASKG